MAKHSSGYSAAQLGLHWLIVLLVFFQLIFGEVMGQYNRALRTGADVAPLVTGYYLHVTVGALILLLAVLRLVLRLTRGVPTPVPGPALQVKAGEALHYIFYLMLIVVPVTGLLAQYVDLRTFGGLHELNKPLFIIFIVLHAGAALYHHFVLKDTTLRRMMVPGSM